MYGYIYKIVNNINKKIYIGCTKKNIEKRFNEHKKRFLKSDLNLKLYNSFKKYGLENFNIELIETCELEIIFEREIYYIKLYDSFNKGLNSTLGGKSFNGYILSKKLKNKAINSLIENGNSHKNKNYDILYGNIESNNEKEKRKIGVKLYWDSLSEDEKKLRCEKMRDSQQKKSKYDINFIKEIKNNIKNGFSSKEFKLKYPNIRLGLYYELKSNARWKNV